MAELVVNLPQAEYQTFLKKVAKLRKAGVDVQYQVAQAKKRIVKITMLTPVEPDKWDAICDGGTSGYFNYNSIRSHVPSLYVF